MKIIIITAMLLIGPLTYASAQNERNSLPAEISNANNIILADTVLRQINEQILFRMGESDVDPSYMGNAKRLDAFISALKRVLADPDYIVNRIEVVGAASPTGHELRNIYLAGKRAESLARYLQLHAAVSADKIEVINAGENWVEPRMMIMESKSIPYREAMLKLIEIPDRDTRKHKMMFYADSKPWFWMQNNFFNSLRMSGMSFSYELSPEAKQCIKERVTTLTQGLEVYRQLVQPIQMPITTPLKAKSFKPLIALKTDLMLWGGVMPSFEMGAWTPNLSAEIYFARRWSVQVGYAYSNWSALTGTKELYAVSVADMEIRHWFGKPSQFKGFFLGAHGQCGQYDVQKGILGQTGSFWNAGLGAGYLLPLSRHWALEAEIRGGYRSTENEVYDIEQDHTYYNNKQTNSKFNPQFRLQVVYRIGKTQK